MTATRRGALTRPATTCTAVALALVAAACAPPRTSGPPGVPDPSASGSPPTARATPPPDLPVMLLAGSSGLAATRPGRPLERVAVTMPPGAWQPTAAVGPHGTVLLVSAPAGAPTTALEGTVTGTGIAERWTVSLPTEMGKSVLPGCVAADGRATVIGDRLIYLQDGRVAGVRAYPATAGRCQMTDDDGVVAYLVDVDHAVAFWRPSGDVVVITATRCDDFGLGGDLLACLAADDGGVVVGRWLVPVAGGPAFDARSAQHLPGRARQVVLAPDGRWLAVAAQGDATVTVFRRGADGFAAVTAFTLAAGEALLGFPGP